MALEAVREISIREEVPEEEASKLVNFSLPFTYGKRDPFKRHSLFNSLHRVVEQHGCKQQQCVEAQIKKHLTSIP